MVRLGVGNAVGAAAKDSCCFLFRLGSDSLRRRSSVCYYTAAAKIPQSFRSFSEGFCRGRCKEVEKAVNVAARTETTTNQKQHRMKNIIEIHNILTRSTVAITLAGLGLLSNAALAQEKGAAILMRINQRPVAPISPPAGPKTTPMSCEKCKDVVVQVPDWGAKGGQILMAGGRPMKAFMQHQCEGCSTTFTVVGHGKAKKDVAQHTCTSCGADSKSRCTAMENGKPTPGM